jgi:RNA polymerase sigma factor (sigma-70 family)
VFGCSRQPDRKATEELLRSLRQGVEGLLTPRQIEVLQLVAEGLTNREIAQRLGLSERTVDRHVSDTLTRIDVPTRAAATAFAISHGLIVLPPARSRSL